MKCEFFFAAKTACEAIFTKHKKVLFSKSDIKAIVYSALLEYTKIVNSEGLPEANEPEDPIPIGDPEDFFDEHEGEEPFEQPRFEIFLNSAPVVECLLLSTEANIACLHANMLKCNMQIIRNSTFATETAKS
ncbi:MAG: hypothetical protein FWG30_04790 [Eubacteriaceae bacterium]|nr:hypothetical protein [Eubacteriaceae bacterium]